MTTERGAAVGAKFRRALAPIRRVAVGALAVALLVASWSALAADPRPVHRPGKFLACDRYDEAIQAATAEYWRAGPDWLFWKAQIYAESRCNPAARSPAGAEGIAQFMGATWADVSRRMGTDPRSVPRTTARVAIRYGALYMADQHRTWRRWAPMLAPIENHRFAMASYNSGAGHQLNSWRACGRPATWAEAVACLHQFTGRHAAETRAYGPKIERFRDEMLGKR